jgi:3-oxoacyl-[acyl-carrier protein] reductase
MLEDIANLSGLIDKESFRHLRSINLAGVKTMTNTNLKLAGKVALVTGGSRSIGAAIARRLAADGAAVAITYSASPDRAAEVVADIEAAGGTTIAIEADAGSPDAVRAAVATTVEHLGGLDILVNNAGIAINAPIEDFRFGDYERMLAVNVTGVFVATQEAARRMTAGGRIIHIGSSMTRYAAFPTASVYTLTKGAVAGFNRSLARDLGPNGITVNTVHPGPTDTDMNPADGPVAAIVGPGMAIGRYGQSSEIASVVAFLASAEAAFVTGADIVADGGLTA